MFKDRDAVARALDLPGPVPFSVIGEPTDDYRDRLIGTIRAFLRLGEDEAPELDTRASRGGRYTAYRFVVEMRDIDQVEAFYVEIARISGTRIVI